MLVAESVQFAIALYEHNIVGLSFQVQFVKLYHIKEQESGQESGQELSSSTMCFEILRKIMDVPLPHKDISEAFGKKQVSGYLNRTLSKLIEDKLIEYTIPDNKNHPDQRFRITKRGAVFLELLKK